MIARFNNRVAQVITDLVATMWCAYLFAALALISLPSAIRGGSATLVAWIAQTFLQLVLLSVIMVGQKIQAASTDALHEKLDAHAREVGKVHHRIHLLHLHLTNTTGEDPT